MWAMIPMLRTLARSITAVSSATVSSVFSQLGSECWCLLGLPAVVREGLVRLGHLVGVLASLDAGTEAVARVEQLVHQPLGHGLLAALPGVAHHPAQGQGRGPVGLDLDRDLVGRTAHAAGLDFQGRLDVFKRALERDDRVVAGLLAAALEGAVDDA